MTHQPDPTTTPSQTIIDCSKPCHRAKGILQLLGVLLVATLWQQNRKIVARTDAEIGSGAGKVDAFREAFLCDYSCANGRFALAQMMDDPCAMRTPCANVPERVEGSRFFLAQATRN